MEHVSKIVAASLGFAQDMLWEALSKPIFGTCSRKIPTAKHSILVLAIRVKVLGKRPISGLSPGLRVFSASAHAWKKVFAGMRYCRRRRHDARRHRRNSRTCKELSGVDTWQQEAAPVRLRSCFSAQHR